MWLSSSAEIAQALPHLLGFHPRESVVLICLSGQGRRRVGLTLRADLVPGDLRPGLVDAVTGPVLREAPAEVVVAVVSESADVGDDDRTDAHPQEPPGLPHRGLVHQLVLRLAGADVPVRAALLVRGGSWWSYDCTEDCCAPGVGTPLPGGTSPLAAASALAGQVVLADRAGLEQRIAPVQPGPAADEVHTAVGLACAERWAQDGAQALAEESWLGLTEVVDRWDSPEPISSPALTDAEVARLAWGLRDVLVRDRAMGLCLGPAPAAVELLWTELTRRAPAPLDAAPATLLAVSAWLRGDGALANVALDRALASDPGYRLAHLLRQALDAAVPPAALRELVSSAAGEAGRSG